MFRTLSGRAPKVALPSNTIDCHMHITDDATVEHYRQVQQWLGLQKVVVVQSNKYQKDNRILLDALSQFGGSARGIVAVDENVSEVELTMMHERGVRGVRMMDLMNGAVRTNELLAVNAKTKALGWSTIVQFNGHDIDAKAQILENVEGDFVIDHVGRFMPPVDPQSAEFARILKLIDRGNCYIKIAGFYEYSDTGAPAYDDIAPMVKAFLKHAPERIIWGSNWPHLMASDASNYPDDVQLLDVVIEWLTQEGLLEQVLVNNPARLYQF